MQLNDHPSRALHILQVVWLRNGRAYVKKTMPSAMFASAMLVQVCREFIAVPIRMRMRL